MRETGTGQQVAQLHDRLMMMMMMMMMMMIFHSIFSAAKTTKCTGSGSNQSQGVSSPCVYQNYSRSKIREVAVKKHNYICRYNNLPTTCFGLDRPSSGWDTTSEENIYYKYRYGGTRSRLRPKHSILHHVGVVTQKYSSCRSTVDCL